MGAIKRKSFLKRSSVKKKRSKPRRGRVIDSDYKAYISDQPCCVCQAMHAPQSTKTEVAHVGDRGLGQKCDDDKTLPICEKHHRTGPLALHVLGRKFWSHFGIDKESLIAQYRSLYGSVARIF